MTTQPPPDWSTITEDIRCPLCEYSLRGLTDPRCPECGYAFEWPDILDPTRRLHPYLFEHHPERNLRSFRQTAAGELLPRRFWRSLHPVQPSFPRRLVLYWLMAALLFYFVCTAGTIWNLAWSVRANLASNVAWRAQQLAAYNNPQTSAEERAAMIQGFDSIQSALDYWFPTKLTWRGFVILIPYALREAAWPLLPIIWPWLTFAALMIFQMSMRRAKVKAVHILRCAIYTGGTLVWAAVIIGIIWLIMPVLQRFRFGPDVGFWLKWGPLWLAFLVATYHLTVAYRKYLRFDHPILTVLASQVVVGLALLKIWALFTVDRY